MYIVLQRVITHRGDDWKHRKTRAKALDILASLTMVRDVAKLLRREPRGSSII